MSLDFYVHSGSLSNAYFIRYLLNFTLNSTHILLISWSISPLSCMLTCVHLQAREQSSVSAQQVLGLWASCRLHQSFCQTEGALCLLYGL